MTGRVLLYAATLLTYLPSQLIAAETTNSVETRNEFSNPNREESETADEEQPGKRSDGLVRVVTANFSAERIARLINEQQTTATVRIRGKLIGFKVPSFILRDVSLETALEQLISSIPNSILYRPADQPNTYEIWDAESYRMQVLPTLVRPKVFLLKHINSEEAQKAIQGVLTPNIGTLSFDPRSNKLFLTDLPPVIELAQRLLEHIDVAFITRVFYVSNADVQELADKLNRLRSPAAPEVIADVRTRQIIVKDRLDRIRQMEQLVETLDIGDIGKAAGTPLHSWKVVSRKGNEVEVEGQDRRRRIIRTGEAVPFSVSNGTHLPGGRIVLKYLSEPETTLPGRVAVFSIERDPVEVSLPLPDAD